MTDRREQFRDHLDEFVSSMIQLSATWGALTGEHPDDETVLSHLYPFHLSFDDLIPATGAWRDHVAENLGKPTPDLPPLRRNYLEPAEPHKIWLLRHIYSPRSSSGTGYVEPFTDITPFVDPRTALDALATHVRQEWPRHVGVRRGIGEMPPDSMDAVAAFYENPRPRGTPFFDVFSLDEVPIVYRRTPLRKGEQERVLMLPYGETTCQCSNTADGYGFVNSDAYGRVLPEDAMKTDHLLCRCCGRVFEMRTGRVVTRLPLCKNCGCPVLLVTLTERYGDKEPGDLMWQHTADDESDEERISCGGVSNRNRVAEPRP